MNSNPTLRSLWTGGKLLQEDYQIACQYVFDQKEADLTIAPDGQPYLYRWHVSQRNPQANVYLHLQVANDPERPLHDHPWDNMSVILAGGYDELLQKAPDLDGPQSKLARNKGDVVFRQAEEAHRLFLPSGTAYTLTLFSTGPHRRSWGFWLEHPERRWIDAEECIATMPDGRSVWTGPKS